MTALTDACREFEQVLHGVLSECQLVSLELDQLNGCTRKAAERLKIRLMGIGNEIIRSEESLYMQHGSKGHVFLFMGANGGLSMHWVENEDIVADRYGFRYAGLTVVSINEVANIIVDLLEKVDLGNCVEVVVWINKYGCQPFL